MTVLAHLTTLTFLGIMFLRMVSNQDDNFKTYQTANNFYDHN